MLLFNNQKLKSQNLISPTNSHMHDGKWRGNLTLNKKPPKTLYKFIKHIVSWSFKINFKTFFFTIREEYSTHILV